MVRERRDRREQANGALPEASLQEQRVSIRIQANRFPSRIPFSEVPENVAANNARRQRCGASWALGLCHLSLRLFDAPAREHGVGAWLHFMLRELSGRLGLGLDRCDLLIARL